MSMRIAIVGSGAVGCFYGGRLAQYGHDVLFLMRSDYDVVKQEGLRIISPAGDVHLKSVQCSKAPQEIGPCDLVIIAIKVTANAALPELLAPLIGPNTALLTLQNGLGNEEFLAEHFGAERVLGGLCLVAINRIAPGVIRHIGQGRIDLGEYQRLPQARTHAIAEMFQRSGVECVVMESLAAARWKKLVWNIPFNGLSIVSGGLDTAQLLARPELEQRVRDLMTEIIQTSILLGHNLHHDLANDMIERTRVLNPYRPSSLVDYEAGREVEIEPIWGEPVRQAAVEGLQMPFTQTLHEELRGCIQRRDG